jgi:hypothetical protein
MKILAIEKELSQNSAEYEPHLKAEARAVWSLQKSGIVREIYFTEETHEAVLILECESAAEAKDYLNRLPLVKNGLIRFDVSALKSYTGFERLFS